MFEILNLVKCKEIGIEASTYMKNCDTLEVLEYYFCCHLNIKCDVSTGIYYDGEKRNQDKIPESHLYVPHTECLSEKLIYPQVVNTTADLDTNFTVSLPFKFL